VSGKRPARRYLTLSDPSLLAFWGAPPPACDDCGKPTHPYMVRPSRWRAVDPGSALRFLCIPCFERRLGRNITRVDLLPNYPINMWLRWRRGKLVQQSPEVAYQTMRTNYGSWHKSHGFKWDKRRSGWVRPR
jgi:hypothetical protein